MQKKDIQVLCDKYESSKPAGEEQGKTKNNTVDFKIVEARRTSKYSHSTNTYFECLLHARAHAKYFTYITSFHLHKSPAN